MANKKILRKQRKNLKVANHLGSDIFVADDFYDAESEGRDIANNWTNCKSFDIEQINRARTGKGKWTIDCYSDNSGEHEVN